MPNPSELERVEQEAMQDEGDLLTAAPTREKAAADIDAEMDDFDEGRHRWPAPGAFEKELEKLINRYNMERAGGDTPDFILARFLRMQLDIFHATVRRRESWHGREEKLVDRRMEVYERG